MALDDLIARLEQDADAQVAAIAGAAAEEVAAIAAAADQAVSEQTARARATARSDRQLAFARALADHRRELRARELAATRTLVAQVFARVRAHLPGLAADPAWAALWPTLADEALSYVGDAPCRVRASGAVIEVLRRDARLPATVQLVEDAETGPGLIVEATDGSVRVDATLKSLLSQRQEQLAMGLIPVEVAHAS